MSASEPTRPDTVGLQPASTTPHGAETHREEARRDTPHDTASKRGGSAPAKSNGAQPDGAPKRRLEPSSLKATRLEQCLGGALCLLALALGVWVGLRVRAASSEADLLPERRTEVAALTPAAKEQLRHQYARFATLPPEQQQRLRDFDVELSAADDGPQLRETLRRYSDWLRTVSLADRNELLKMAGDPERRLHRVKELSPFSPPDANVLDQWVRQTQRFGWWREDDLKKLAGRLSELRRSELERQKSISDKWALLRGWVQRRRWSSESRFGAVSNDELVRFYTGLNDDARRKLLALPREQRNRELREQYRKAHPPSGGRRPVSAPRESGSP